MEFFGNGLSFVYWVEQKRFQRYNNFICRLWLDLEEFWVGVCKKDAV